MPAKTKSIVVAVASVLIVIIAVVACVLYTNSSSSLQQISMRRYATVEKDASGAYALSVDLNKLLTEQHLPNPYETELNVNDYPDVAMLQSLGLSLTKNADGSYLVQTTSTETDVSMVLRKYGLVLINTEWNWTESDLKTAYEQNQEYPRRLDAQQYALVSRNSDGSYVVTLDNAALLAACGFDLPTTEDALAAHTGYQAVMSLAFRTTLSGDSYAIDTISTLEGVTTLLSDNGVALYNTQWTWTTTEIAAAYEATAPASPVPSESPSGSASPDASVSPEGSASPDASATASATPTATATLTATPTGTATATPTVSPTPGVTPTPIVNPDKSNCLSSLYAYDQTALRKAIRQAKLNYYGSGYKDSEVVANYFIASVNSATQYGNCFRLVLKVTTASGTSYLVADVYNIHASDSFTASNVVMKQYSGKSSAISTSDFSASQYKIVTLEGGSAPFDENSGLSPFDENGLVCSKSLDSKLTTAELWAIPSTDDYSLLRLLGYARNEIFARCGHRYSDSSNYYKYFSSFSWYKPTGEISYSDIAAKYPNGAANISLIKELENLIKVG